MANLPSPQPLTSVPLVDTDLRPSLSWRLYLPRFDTALRGLVNMVSGQFTSPVPLIAAVDDAAAAAAGVQVGQLYRTPTTGTPPHTISIVQIRIT